ncbi:MAG: sigma-70 family RNA polymerase sigma factor [Massilibacteroides sp.]|jgi:RNA polymerase sigma-70 factor (ECF subfamily)|nr:sigma-70 family RNA polymerase sigma factor [Massilibacteroides sp.]MDD3063185.1 sigma-70 family RNA polymerase sigma factor [Massilibacteroides sp.]
MDIIRIGLSEKENCSIDERTDDTIVELVQKGDFKAFEILVSRYEKKIFRFFFRMGAQASDSEDLTQEVFIQAFRGLSKYQARNLFSAWIFTIARNVYKNFLDKQIRNNKLLNLQKNSEDCHNQVAVTQKNSLDEVEAMLSPLPEEYRRVMVLKYISDMSCKEISQIENISESAVKQRLFRAREMIRETCKSEF